MAALNAQKFFSHLSEGRLSTAYLLSGEDGFLLGRALERLVEKSLEGAPRDFNLDVFYARDSKGEDIAAQAQTLPMMAGRRTVVVKEADRLKDIDPVKEYLKSPSPTTVLVLVAENAEKGKEAALAKAVGAGGVCAHFYRPSDSDIARWVGILAKEAGYSVDGDAASYLKDVLGDNLALIEAELNKVFNFKGEQKRVTLADVRESVGGFGLPLVFDLVDQLADKNTGKAVETMSRLIKDGEQPLMILGMVSRHWRRLLEAKNRMDLGDGPKELETRFRLNFKNKERFIRQVRTMNKGELREAFTHMSRADMALKGSALAPWMVMERLALELTGFLR
ncbi:MAG TPA: DNA polymerase III subunit delta [Nitrospirota bacterium]